VSGARTHRDAAKATKVFSLLFIQKKKIFLFLPDPVHSCYVKARAGVSSMQPRDAFFLTRATDHIVIDLIGAFVVWLGYRLFRDMPLRREGESKITLPGGVSILLSRVGPGIFFALFGTAMIGYTASHQVTLEDTDTATGQVHKTSGAFEGALPAAEPTVPQSALPVDEVVKLLAEIARVNDASGKPERFVRETALREARARLMLQSWNPAWGDKDAFASWIFDAAGMPPAPKKAESAAALFQNAPSP